MLALSVGITSVIGLLNFFSNPSKVTPFHMIVLNGLNKYFNQINPEFMEQGLTWKVDEYHYFLLLQIDKAKADEYRKRTNYNPALMSEGEEEGG